MAESHGPKCRSFFDFVFEAPDRQSVDLVARTVKTVAGVTSLRRTPVLKLANADAK